jgi:hypothetical protein
MGGEPQEFFVTGNYYPQMKDVFLLGAIHRGCNEVARTKLENQAVSLPQQLPELAADDQDVIIERLDLPPRLDRCAFCGETDLTDEHVFPRWVSRKIVGTYGSMRRETPYGVKPQNTIEQIAQICATCNNEWLGTLENDVSPILGPMIVGPQPGEPLCRQLDSDQQRLIATWAVKTAYMLDLSGQQPIIPAFYYQQLRQYREALPSTVVWIAGYNGMDRAVYATHGGICLDASRIGEHNAFMTTFSVCRVIFKVIGYANPAGPQVTFTYDSRFEPALQRIWPVQPEPVEWPRGGMGFNDEALVELANEHLDGSDLRLV